MATSTIKPSITKDKLLTDAQVSAGNKSLSKSIDGYDLLYIQVASSSNGSTYGNHMPFLFLLPLEGSGVFFVSYVVSSTMLIQFNFTISGTTFGISWADIQGYQKGRINIWGIKFG